MLKRVPRTRGFPARMAGSDSMKVRQVIFSLRVEERNCLRNLAPDFDMGRPGFSAQVKISRLTARECRGRKAPPEAATMQKSAALSV